MSIRSGDVAQYFTVLGLQPGATIKEVEHAYRGLVKAWHPDHFTHDPQLRQVAQEKLKQINIACDFLRAHQAELEALSAEARRQAEAAAAEAQRREQEWLAGEQLRRRQQAHAEEAYRRREQQRLDAVRRQQAAANEHDTALPWDFSGPRRMVRSRGGRVTPWFAPWDQVPTRSRSSRPALGAWMMMGLVIGLSWGIFHTSPPPNQGIDLAFVHELAIRFVIEVFVSMFAGALVGLALAAVWDRLRRL